MPLTRWQARATLQDVWDGIRFQPGRAALSFFAIAIGMVSLTVLLAVLGGLSDRSHKLIEEFGAGVFAVTARPDAPAAAGGSLRERHAALIAANQPECRVAASRRFDWRAPGSDDAVAVLAVEAAMLEVRGWTVLRGRFLDERDVRGVERNAVITRGLSDRRGWDVGQVVALMGIPFTIVGVVDAGAAPAEAEGGGSRLLAGEQAAYVPLRSARLWQDREPARASDVDAVFVRVPAGGDLEQVRGEVEQLLSAPDLRVRGLDWVTPDVLLRGVRRLQAMIGITVGSIAVLCMLLGGTTLMSLIVANVRDRVPEIGLRRALGAEPWEVALLFVLESCLLTGAAALAGTVLTHAALGAAQGQMAMPVRLGLASFLGPIALAIVFGAVFSYMPARIAARIAPAEALRDE